MFFLAEKKNRWSKRIERVAFRHEEPKFRCEILQ